MTVSNEGSSGTSDAFLRAQVDAWISSPRGKRLLDQAARNATRHGCAPPDFATIQLPPHDDRCDCCQEIQVRREGAKRAHGLLQLDHDHLTGAFRGWLCSKCNRGIGLLRDSVAGVQSAVDYLRHECPWLLPYRSPDEQKAWCVEHPEPPSPRLQKLLQAAVRNAKRLGYAPPDGATIQPAHPDGRCDCCQQIPKSGRGLKRQLVERYLDYDHKTGAFRGWLCNPCNRGIGLLRDTAAGVENALHYLRRDYPWESTYPYPEQ